MNSKQPARYIKRSMGDTLKKSILVHNVIIDEESKPIKPILACPRCNFVNALQNKVCQECNKQLANGRVAGVHARLLAHIIKREVI